MCGKRPLLLLTTIQSPPSDGLFANRPDSYFFGRSLGFLAMINSCILLVQQKKVECRKVEFLASGLEGLDGKPAHPCSKGTTPANDCLLRKRQNNHWPFLFGLRDGGVTT